jgi:hypothetical protein
MRYVIAALILIVVLATATGFGPATGAQVATPEASPTALVSGQTGELVVPEEFEVLFDTAPESATAYLGFWNLFIEAGTSVVIPAIESASIGNTISGVVSLDPPSPTGILGEPGGTQGEDDGAFRWPDGAEVTVENAGNVEAQVQIAGLLHPNSSLESFSVSNATLQLQAGVLIANKPGEEVIISIAKFRLTSGSSAIFAPANFPSIMSAIKHPVEISTMLGVSDPELAAIPAVLRIDEPLPNVRVLNPVARVAIHVPEGEDSVFWVVGVDLETTDANPNCRGRCLTSG